MTGLDDLAAAFRGAQEQLGEAQSAAGVTRDRADEALRTIAAVSDGTGNVLITNALERIAAADAAIEEVLGMYVSASEQIETYLQARGL